MNIRKIVTYNALRRGFTADELAFADVLYNATESERELLINALQPEKPAGKKAGKKSSKPSSSKSPRATDLNAQLSKRREQGRAATTIRNGDDEDSYCAHQYEHDGMVVECGEPADQNIHHLRTIEGYHPFVSEFAVPTAPTQSPANGGSPAVGRSTQRTAHTLTVESDDKEGQDASSSVADSEIEKVDAGSAVLETTSSASRRS